VIRRTLNALLAAGALAAFTSSEAGAGDSKKVCTDAYAQAQTLRDANKLKEAREQLRICSQATCKAFIVRECTAWLVEIESRVPSIVLSAKDAHGTPVTDVFVSMDGTPISQKLDGESIEVDPGPHTFTFVASDGTKVEQSLAVLEGQKAQSVAVSIPTAASAASVARPKAEQQTGKAPLPPPDFWTTQRAIGVATGGVGVAGIAVGSVFGLLASSKWNSSKSECPAAGCSDHAAAVADHDSASSMATVSTVAFTVGGVALATGAILFLTGAKMSAAETPEGIVVAPTVGAAGPGLVAVGVF
jgi:hypothetical protein